MVKLTYDFEELTRRKEQAEREQHKKHGEETFAAELEALEKLDQTEFARVLDEEWERIRSGRGVRYSKESANLYTDTLGRPLSGSVLQGLSVERLKLVIRLALERPKDYGVFHAHLQGGHPYLASSLPTPEEIERHRSAGSVAEFLKAWKGISV